MAYLTPLSSSPYSSSPRARPSLFPSTRPSFRQEKEDEEKDLKGFTPSELPHIVVETGQEMAEKKKRQENLLYSSSASSTGAGEGRLIKGKIHVQGQLTVTDPETAEDLADLYQIDNDVTLQGPESFTSPSKPSGKQRVPPPEQRGGGRIRTARSSSPPPSLSSSSPPPLQSILSRSMPSSLERKKTRKNISFSPDTVHYLTDTYEEKKLKKREDFACSRKEERDKKSSSSSSAYVMEEKKWFNDPELTKLTDPPDRLYKVRNRIRVQGTCPADAYILRQSDRIDEARSERQGDRGEKLLLTQKKRNELRYKNVREFGRFFADKDRTQSRTKKKEQQLGDNLEKKEGENGEDEDQDDTPAPLAFTAEFIQEGEVLVNARDSLQRVKAEMERDHLRHKLRSEFSDDLPGTLSGRLIEPYVRKAAYEMLNISDMCEGHGWRVLEELRRLLVLRQGRVSLPWDREEESCRVCLAHLALLKRTFENTVFDDVREDCLMAPPHASSHFQLEESSLLSSSSAGHLLSSPSARSQTLGDLPVGDPGGGIRREDSPLKKKVSFSLHASLRAPADATEKREVSYYGQSNLRRQNAVRHQWMKDLRKSLELSTAYATKGRKQPAVFLRIAALKPLLVYRHLNSAEVKMILVEVFQRLWMKFVEYSLARQVRVSTAALVLDCSFLTEYDCSSGAFHFLMKDLRDVVRAFCPLVIRRVIFFNYTQAHERIWLILRSAVENACFFSFYDDDRDLATEIEGERPFIYHTMLLNKRDLSLLTQVLPPLYVGLGGDSNHNRRRQSSASKACLSSSSSSSFSYLDDLLPLRYFRVSPKIPEALFGEKEEEGLLREAYSSSSSGVVPSCSVDFLENQLRVFRLLAGTLVVLASADLEPEMPGRDIFKEAVRTPEQVASSLAARIRGKEEEEETKTDDFSVVLRLGEKLARLLTYKEAACFWKGLNDLRDIFVEKKRERRRQRRQAQGKDEEEEEDDEDDDEEEDDGGLIDPEGHLGPSEEALREAAQRAKEKKWREEDPTFQVDEEKRRRRTCEIFDAIFAKQDEVKAELEETSFEELFEKSVADAVNDKLRGEGLRVPSSSRYLQSWSPSGETGGEVTGATSDLSLLGRRLFPVPLDLVCRSRISPQVDQIYAEGFPEDDLPKLFSVPQASSTSKYLTMRTRG